MIRRLTGSLGRRRLLALAAVVALAAGARAWTRRRARADVTFTRDVAPIVHAKCAGCHRPGEAGPFNLLTYDDVAERAAQIVDVTSSRYMPPWKPLPGFASYANQRGLSDAEIDVFRRWHKGGAPRGEAADLPLQPSWPAGWQLGEPDLVLPLPETYTLPAQGRDVYRNFVLPSGVTGARWISAWELRGGSRTIHHAILNVDRTGAARRRDAADPEPGYDGMSEAETQSPDGFYLVWTPGKTPAAPSPGSAWRLDERTDLVLQLHLQPSGKPEPVRPTIGLFFAKAPPTRPRLSLRVGDAPIDIPPGETRYAIHDALTLPADVEVLGLFPHAHYLARTVQVFATLPDGSRRWLLNIADWDPAWQDEYTFEAPIALPKGASIAVELTYDNSEGNPRNPSRPPVRVVTGERSVDEMGNVTLQVSPRDPADMPALREAKYRWQLARTDDGRTNYNLANALADEGRAEDAIAGYRRAVERDPSLAAALYNLGNLLRARGALDEAILAYERAAALEPGCGPLTNLGAALEKKGKREAARGAFARAIAADARCAPAENSLASSLADGGDAAAALAHFERALAIEPDNALSRFRFGKALEATGRKDDAAAQYRLALARRPGYAEAKAALDALAR